MRPSFDTLNAAHPEVRPYINFLTLALSQRERGTAMGYAALTHPTSYMRRIETNRDALPGFASFNPPFFSIPVKPALIFLDLE